MPPPYIGLFRKVSEFKEILRTCTEPTSLLHEKTTKDNLRQFRTNITKVFEFKEIREFTLTPNPFPIKKLLETTPSSYLEAWYKENKNLSSVFFIFFLTNIVFFCKFQRASQSSAGILSDALAVCLYGNVPEIATVCVNNLK